MCSIDWGLVVNSVAAVGSIAAAVVALWIATKDRRERKTERNAADRAQAELVVVKVSIVRARPLAVQVTNFGSAAVLDVTFDSAEFATVPDSVAKVDGRDHTHHVLDNDRNTKEFFVDFVDTEGKSALPGEFDEDYSSWAYDNRPDTAQVTARVRFRDSSGNRWRRSTDGTVERLH